jgi:predicted ATPase
MGRDWPRAVKYLRHAAHSAGRQYAHREAASYLGRALSALDRLPDADRAEHELDVLKHLGVNLQVTRGFAAEDVETIHARAYALCRSSGDVARTFPVVWGIWLFHKVRSDLWRAREMCDELLAMARASGDAALLLQAHQAMCVTHLCLGVPEITVEHMERAAAVYDPTLHAANTLTFGQDPGVATLAFGAVALWLLGRADEALAASERSLELARRLDQPSSLALAMHFAAMLHQVRGDAAATAHWAEKTIGLASEEGFSFWLAGGLVFRGWARAVGAGSDNEAESDAGIGEIRRGLDAWLATGSRTYHTYYLGLLADALQRAERPEESLPVLDGALEAAQRLPEGLYEAELHRLRGQAVLLTSDDSADPEAHDCFSKALSTARAQGANWFEDRAATDLARLGAPKTSRKAVNIAFRSTAVRR